MKKQILSILLVLYSTALFSMGGDKPGPNGGYITMPGTYHLELVDKGDELRIYLLDINIKNPETKNSSASINNYPCKLVKNYFTCLKSEIKFKTLKEIKITSTRNNVKGSIASYSLPLTFK